MDKYKELVELTLKENIIIGGGHLDANGEATLTFCFNNKIDHIQEIKLPINMPNEEMLRRIKQYKKPPLGIKPHFIWIEQRIEEIKEAINRRIEVKENIPHEWYIELAQLENERIANTTHLEINIPQEQFNNLKTDAFSNSPMPNETVSEYFERRVKQRYLTI